VHVAKGKQINLHILYDSHTGSRRMDGSQLHVIKISGSLYVLNL